MMVLRSILFVGILLTFVYSSHFRGGIITWRPLNNVPSNKTVQIQVHQRYSWRRSFFLPPCNDTTIANGGITGSNGTLKCYTGVCSTSGWGKGISTIVYCTDFSVSGDLSSGEQYYTFTLALNISISVGYVYGAWLSNLAIGGNSQWYVINRISTKLRPDGLINSSPVVATLPVIYKAVNIAHVHTISMSDIDTGDILKCRWSIGTTWNINSYNECGGVCSGIHGANLSTNNCTLTFKLTQVNKFYAVALQVEDYYSSSSSTPMSSVPIQFLFYSYHAPSGCSIPPAIISDYSNGACIGTAIGSNVTQYVIAQVFCTGKNITDFITSSPIGMKKSEIMNIGTNLYQIILSWIPQASQYGPQGFCAGAVDNTKVQSDQWCITFLVGFASPNLIPTTMVQGTASPIGTVFANHTIFSIQATRRVSRATHNGTFVYFNDAATRTIVYSMDCGWNPNVIYTGTTVVFRVLSPPWIPGHSYYITFDRGVASGIEFCGPESSPISDPSFWVFNIWNPALSSTMTTTNTSSVTIGTITTRDLSTMNINTRLTTTGIARRTTSTNLPTLNSTTTTKSNIKTSHKFDTKTTTTTTSLTITTTLASIHVTYPTNMEETCKQPIIIMNTIMMGIMAIIHALGMYVGFIKLIDKFEPSRLNHVQRINRINRTSKIINSKPKINKVYPMQTDITSSKKSSRIVHFKE